MRLFTILFCFLFVSVYANAQQNYDVSLIPKNLLPYAKAVIRNKEVSVNVKDYNNTLCHIKEAITILNKNGDDMARILVWHDKNNVIKNIKGATFDESGKQTGKFSENNFEDVNTTDGYSLFQDTKVKHYEPVATEYPYTIEYEYEVRSIQSLDFDDWKPNDEMGVAVENSSYTFTCKPDFKIRYKEINMPTAVNIGTNKDGLKTYTWQVNNLKAIKDEPFSPNPQNYLSIVKIAPEKFEYWGLGGSFTNWNELGKWMYDNLLEKRKNISSETIQHIQQITADISDPKLKAKKIYEYVQNKTHYVSVQIGIGGLEPFLASDVDMLNYGDCKALVNYTQALLKAINIDSYYCVVMANPNRKLSLITDFASIDQANHIILCIPFKNDTTWADCTSKTLPFGYLGDFTDDRTVLACTPEGGKLLRTPKYTAESSLQERKANFVIDDTGGLSGDMMTTFRGTQYDNREWLIDESQVEKLKDIAHVYPINNMDIERLEFKQDKSFQPVTSESMKLRASEFASMDNDKIYFLLNPVNRRYQSQVPREVHNRVTNVYINDGYTDVDEMTYTVPAGYHLDSNPLDTKLSKPFGNFTATMAISGNQIKYKRRLQIIDGTYPKAIYQELVDFYQAVAEADAYSVRLIKSN